MILGTWWRATRGSNPGPLVPETNALSTELVARSIRCILDTAIWPGYFMDCLGQPQRLYLTQQGGLVN